MKDLLTHSLAILIAIFIPGCIWLVAVLIGAAKQHRKLKKQLLEGKIILDDHEKAIG